MIKEIFKQIESAKHILIITHVNPDGDTLGSACAMKSYLGERADILVQNREGEKFPETYWFLPFIDEVKYQETVRDEYDLVIALDTASVDRIVGNARNIFNKAQNTINIDHHKTNNSYGKLNLINPDASSVGEVLFYFFKELNIEITREMGDCLYCAILTDTGGFRYENTKEKTLSAAKELIKIGVDVADIAQKYYDYKPKPMVLLHSFAVANAVFLEDDKIVYTVLTDEIMNRFGAKNEHTEGIAETLRSMSSTEISFVAKEVNSNSTKISLRSKNVDLVKIVEKFNGGGHSKSAGCTIRRPVSEAVNLLICEIKKEL